VITGIRYRMAQAQRGGISASFLEEAGRRVSRRDAASKVLRCPLYIDDTAEGGAGERFAVQTKRRTPPLRRMILPSMTSAPDLGRLRSYRRRESARPSETLSQAILVLYQMSLRDTEGPDTFFIRVDAVSVRVR